MPPTAWFTRWFPRRTRPLRRPRPAARPWFERLEDREVPAVLTWTGAGTTNNWSEAANWLNEASVPAVPAPGDDLLFTGTPARTTANNDLGDVDYNRIAFSGPTSYTITGQEFGLTRAAADGPALSVDGDNVSITFNTNGLRASGDAVTFAVAAGDALTLTGGPVNLQDRLAATGNDLTLSVDGALTLSSGLTAGSSQGSLTLAGAGQVSLDGVLSGALDVAQTGALNTTLMGDANTFTGFPSADPNTLTADVTISAGTFTVLDTTAAATPTPFGDAGNVVTVSGTGTLAFAGGVTVPNAVTLDGGKLTVDGTAANSAGKLTLAAGGGTVTVADKGVLAAAGLDGAGKLLKDGAGRLELAADAPTFTGAVTIANGVASAEAAQALGTGAVTVQTGGTFEVNAAVTVANPLTLSGAGVGAGGALLAKADVTYTGPVTLAANSTVGAAAGTLKLAGLISGAGGLSTTGAGTVEFAGTEANTFQGPFTAANPLVRLNAAAVALPSDVTVNTGATLKLVTANQIAPAADLTVNDGGVFDLGGKNQTVASLAGAGKVTGGGELTVNGAASTTFAGNISGTTAFRYDGTGTLTLSGTSDTTAATTVTNGTLLVDGSLAGSAVGLSGKGTLGGKGTVGPLTAAGGTVAPGGSDVGTLTVQGGVTLAGSTLSVQLNGAGAGQADQVLVPGDFPVDLNNATLNVTLGYTPAAGDKLTLVSAPSKGVVGTFAGLADGATLTVGSSRFLVDYAGDSVTLTAQSAVTTTTTLAVSQPSVTFGTALTFTATVRGQDGGGVPAGRVDFFNGTTLLGSGTLAGSGTTATATFTTQTPLAAGTLQVRAVYVPTGGFAESSSDPQTVTVNPAPTTVTLTANPNPVTQGGVVTLTASVASSATGAGTPTGTVTFLNGTTVLGTATLNNGTATFQTSALPAGTQSITARFDAQGSFAADTSDAVGVTVNPPGTTQPTVAGTPPAARVGQAFSFTFTVTGTPAPTVSVTGLPAGLTFNPATNTISGTPTAAGTFNLTVTATNSAGTSTISPALTVQAAAISITAQSVPAGQPPVVTVRNADGSTRFTIAAYENSFKGGVNVAVGDVTNDGIPDIVTTPGDGGAPLVKVFSGTDGRELQTFTPLEGTFRGGLTLAVGDMTKAGYAQIVVGAGDGGGPRVVVFDAVRRANVFNYFAYSSSLRTGVFVAAGDLNGDGRAEIVTGVGVGGGPQVRGFLGTLASGSDGQTPAAQGSFFAFDQAQRNGVQVSIGQPGANNRRPVLVDQGTTVPPTFGKSFDPSQLGF